MAAVSAKNHNVSIDIYNNPQVQNADLTPMTRRVSLTNYLNNLGGNFDGSLLQQHDVGEGVGLTVGHHFEEPSFRSHQTHQFQPPINPSSQTHFFNHSFDSLLSAKDFEFQPISSGPEPMMTSRKRRADWSSEDALTDFSDISSPDSSSSPKAPMLQLKEREDDPVYGNENIASNFTEATTHQKRYNNCAKGQPPQGRLTWPDDLELDLQQEISNSIYNGDSIFNFSGLTVFKREITQPIPNNYSPDVNEEPQQQQLINNSRNENCNRQQQSGFMSTGGNQTGAAGGSGEGLNQGQAFNSPNQYENNGSPPQPPPMEIGTPPNARENYGQFEYMLKAATAIGQKHNEDSLTYLNQGQSYEIKFKKLGDLNTFRGKLLKSVIKICFYERRLQYMEKEQMRQWQETHPNDRVLELDVPLSYGIVHFNQPANFSFSNMIEVLWDPQQDCGVYIRVNCISTEFTPKKHGGEKGVPFRIQVETYEDTVYGGNKPIKPLHAAACQIKVFKLKGADRKHKQDREKIMKRPPSEQEKYQRSYEYTILNEISIEHLYNMIPNCYSPESIKRNISPASDSPNQFLSKYDALVPYGASGGGLMRTDSMTSTNGLLKQDENEIVSLNKMDYEEYSTPLSAEFSPAQVMHWLSQQRLSKFSNAFSHFSGVDLLRMTKEDLIQICGLADGIRMYNIIHSKSISPRLTIYVTLDSALYHAIYLHSYSIKELFQKLHKIPGFVEPPSSPWNLQTKYSGSNNSLADAVKINLFMIGPANIQVLLTDEVLSNIKNDSLFAVETQNGKILMRPEIMVH